MAISEMRNGQYNILAPPPFSACAVYATHLTAFSIKQWLLQRLFTALAVQRTSQSHLETEESLGPIPLATPVWIKKKREKSIAKALSIPH